MTTDEKLDQVVKDIYDLKIQTQLIASHLESELGHSKRRMEDLEESRKIHESWRYGNGNGLKGCQYELKDLDRRIKFNDLHFAGMWTLILAGSGLIWWGFDLVWRYVK